MKKVLVALFAMTAMIMVSCAPKPGETVKPATPKVTIVVKLSAYDNALDLYQSATAGYTNAVFAVGSFGGMKVSGGAVIPNWDPTSPIAQLTKISNGWYKLVLDNDLGANSNVNFGFKFVNGTPTFGGSWATEEQERTDDGTSWEGVLDRSLAILGGYATNIYLTNDIISNVGGTANGCITHWKNIAATYAVTGINFTIVCLPMITNMTWGAGTLDVANGTNILLWGSFNSWGSVTTNAAVAGGAVTFNVTYAGPAFVEWQLRPMDGGGSFDNGGNNFNFAVSLVQKDGANITITNTGTWRHW